MRDPLITLVRNFGVYDWRERTPCVLGIQEEIPEGHTMCSQHPRENPRAAGGKTPNRRAHHGFWTSQEENPKLHAESVMGICEQDEVSMAQSSA